MAIHPHILHNGQIREAASAVLRAGQIIKRLREFVARGESERKAEPLSKSQA